MVTLAEMHKPRETGHRIPVRRETGPHGRINVGGGERRWSVIGGAALLTLGLARRRVSGWTLAALGGGLLFRGVSGHCPGYEALGVTSVDPQRDAAPPEDYFAKGIHVEHAVTIMREPQELYSFWRQFENLPKFMQHLESVTVLDDKRSHWVARGPAGSTVEWDAEIINDEENATIAWRSLGGAEVDNAGSVRFVRAAGGRGTEVHVVIDYIPPGGRLGSVIAMLFGEEPHIQIKEDLRRFKSLMETGEIATTKGQPRGSCASA